ncbi:hypothetical protein BGZ61DRAFT_116008 [Ilyonectria robusta]|uniref:uncharacterized protein n=1 Tax=Ilyonectria robusta TaxID=1079257 RepID=UPI001E8E734A|nr:uncharacterized protein BGZ61DRAFT_116008 [Ilyonectria robusta]KAH8669282.1 hypothetical protein BGZ61DRAFT_116008 [Ilyonectria robusta]
MRFFILKFWSSAGRSLLTVTSWLLSQVADLGLNLDDIDIHADRIKLWDDFNHAWLGVCQRQIEMMTSSQQLSKSQSLMSKEMIEKMGNELIRLCDGMERHELVDYQYGVVMGRTDYCRSRRLSRSL